jgi:hypothetical protein
MSAELRKFTERLLTGRVQFGASPPRGRRRRILLAISLPNLTPPGPALGKVTSMRHFK